MYFADGLGFLNLQGQPPIADKELRLDLVHATSAFPRCTTMEQILKAHNEFKQCVIGQDQLYLVLKRSDIDRKDGTGVILGLQSPPYDDHIEASIKRLHDAGVRVIQLAYQENSP